MKKLLFAALAAHSPALAGPVEDALALLNAHASQPLPSLTSEHRRKLALGESVAFTIGTEGVAGFRVVDAPMGQAWAAVHNPAVTGDAAVKEVRLSADSDGTEVWYGRMSLPSPLADRQWVVRSTVHRPLHDASGGRAWERSWRELPDSLNLALPAISAGHLEGVSGLDLDQGVITPINRGAWLVVDLGEGKTLVATHVRTDLGGSVPTWLVRDVARRQVHGLLNRVARDVRWAHPEVVGGHGGWP